MLGRSCCAACDCTSTRILYAASPRLHPVCLRPARHDSATGASAQSSAPVPATVVADTVTEVRLKDGSVLVGRVDSSTITQVVLITRAGTRMEIPRAETKESRCEMLESRMHSTLNYYH